VHDGHRAALGGDAARGLEAEQSAADDGRALDIAGCRGTPDRLAVRGIAERVDALEVDAGNRRHERLRAGGYDELVEGAFLDVVDPEDAAIVVDPRDLAADEQLDVVVGEPLGRTQLERFRVLAGDEDLRQPHAVVGGAGLRADERKLDVAIACAHGFADRLAGDPPTDDDDPGAH
jgi:hypothetical protein